MNQRIIKRKIYVILNVSGYLTSKAEKQLSWSILNMTKSDIFFRLSFHPTACMRKATKVVQIIIVVMIFRTLALN